MVKKRYDRGSWYSKMTLTTRRAYLEHTVHENDKMPYMVLHISDTLEHTLPYKKLVRTGGHACVRLRESVGEM